VNSSSAVNKHGGRSHSQSNNKLNLPGGSKLRATRHQS